MTRRNNWLFAIGSLTIAFILGTMLVIPIFNRQEDLLSDYRDDVDKLLDVVGDDPPEEPEAYHYWYAPPRSFGIQETRTVNWTFFKQLFNSHTDWLLEYKRYSYSEWTEGNEYLTIGKTWNDTGGFWKINLTLSVPVDIYSARFTFGCNLIVLDYVEREGYEVWLNYSANATENYSVMFNWSDIASIPGLVITKGKTDDMFWFRFRRDNISSGVYVFDPIFGFTGTASAYSTIENYMRGIFGTTGATAGTADNITANIYVTTDNHKSKCALYTYVDYDTDYIGTQIALTDEVDVPPQSGLVVFPFSEPKPDLLANTNYYILIVGESESGDNQVRYDYEVSSNIGVYDSNSYGTWDSPWTGETEASNSRYALYCSYTCSPPYFASKTQDGYLRYIDADYATAHDAEVAEDIFTTDDELKIGQLEALGTDTIQRAALYFNTTIINSTDTINSAKLFFYPTTIAATGDDFNLVVQTNDTDVYPHDPLVTSDYDKDFYSGDYGGDWNTNGKSADTWYNVSLDTSIINKTGWTRLMLRSNEDVNNSAPSGQEYMIIDSGDTRNFPYLLISYSSEEEEWQTVSDTFNGEFTNITIWQVISDTFNGEFTNTTTWKVVSDTFNGVFTNITEWLTVDDTFNGIFTNTTIWKTIDDTFNGVFTNTTSWRLVDDTFNGEFTNITSWRIIDDTFNGIFTNITEWLTVDDVFNGVFTNATVWQTIDDTFNGVFTNITEWLTVDDTYNGMFINITGITWQTIDDTYNGIFTNTTQWFIIDNTFNGIFTNITSWRTVDDTFNGIFTNITEWLIIDDTFNGIFINTTTWRSIDDTFNGIFTNTTAWQTIDDTFNGVFTNITSWYIISDTFNGVFTNTTQWFIVDDTFNGVFTNITSWRTVDDTFNGIFTNITEWLTVDDTFNGVFTNTTQWFIIDSTFNGEFTNTTIKTWQTIDITFNGEFTNTTVGILWQTIDDTFNGIFTNTTIQAILISNIYPSNLSTNIGLQPYLYATFNSTPGNTLNITWYYNNTILGTETNSTNGTYTELLYHAINRSTSYTWDVKINDGHGNWLNKSYSFTTVSGPIPQRPSNIGIAIFGVMLGALGIIGMLMFTKKKRDKDNYRRRY